MKDCTRLYINARFLTQQTTGVQRFAMEICYQLAKRADVELILLSPQNVLNHQFPKKAKLITFGKYTGHVWEQFDLPKYLKKMGSPLLLNLCNTAPLYYHNTLVTVHDLAFNKHHEWFSLPFRIFYNFLIPKITRKAQVVFTVSKTIKNELVACYQLASSKIHVVYNGLPEVFKTTEPIKKTEEKAPYFLAIGGKNPRKNLNRIIEALELLPNNPYTLRVVGQSDTNFNTKKGKGESAVFPVVFHSNASDEELKQLYVGAKGLIYPSLYEGFGIPPLEALNLNCPIILSNITVFKELYANFAIFVDPYNIDSISKGIQKLAKGENKPIDKEELLKLNTTCSFDHSAAKILDAINNL
jgi:glycosyltransferase involved in cell wall biosynthesis